MISPTTSQIPSFTLFTLLRVDTQGAAPSSSRHSRKKAKEHEGDKGGDYTTLYSDGTGYGNLTGLANDPVIWPKNPDVQHYDEMRKVNVANCR